MSKLRRPASTWAVERWSLLATSEVASVELMSPYTTVSAGSSSSNAGSSAVRSAAVWTAWLPDPTPRLMSGSGRPSSLKKMSDIVRS
jgi:hypothetical protein